MNFYMLLGNAKYSDYIGASEADDVKVRMSEPRSPEAWKVPLLREYLGDPPGRPRKKGHFHGDRRVYLFSQSAVGALKPFLGLAGTWLPVLIEGRDESFHMTCRCSGWQAGRLC